MLKALSSIFLVAAVIVFFNVDTVLPKQEIKIQTSRTTYSLIVEVAKEREEQQIGLMGRETMDIDEGMLFVYEAEVTPAYWMKNMEMPLDILFIDKDQKIIHIAKDVPPCTSSGDDCELYSPSSPIKYVLELRAGFTDEFKVGVGDVVRVD